VGEGLGRTLYPQADQLLICADGGGSNGYRPRLWKVELQVLADTTGLRLTVCHFEEINADPVVFRWKYKMDEVYIV